MQSLVNISLLVREYDEALDFYVNKLRFELEEDTYLNPQKRWIRIKPPGEGKCCLLLARAINEEQESRIGNQTGGRVFLFLHTDDFYGDYNNLVHHSIRIVRPPSREVYGTVAVFEDLYGNLIDLIGPKDPVT